VTFEEELEFIVLQTKRECEMSAIGDRLKQKAMQAVGVGPRVAAHVEANLDWIIAQEKVIEGATVEAVAPHKELFAGVHGTLGEVKDALNILSNGGPPLDASASSVTSSDPEHFTRDSEGHLVHKP